MTRPTLRARLAEGGTALGTMVFEFHTLGLPRIAANAGADFVMLDLEHTGWGVEGIRPLLAAAGAYDVEPLVTLETKRAILTKAAREGWLVIFEHDATVASGKVKLDGKGFALDQRP